MIGRTAAASASALKPLRICLQGFQRRSDDSGSPLAGRFLTI